MIWRDEAPRGKLDLLLALDFRMTSTTLFADLVLPAATWYEKHDLSSTDMHPYVHAFSPAIDPPWQARTDFEIFHSLAAEAQRAGRGTPRTRHDLVATALQHDTPGEMPPGGVRRRPLRASSMPLHRRGAGLHRDRRKIAALGPLADERACRSRASP